MESVKRPYCSRRALIEALGHFSPDNPTGPLPQLDDNGGDEKPSGEIEKNVNRVMQVEDEKEKKEFESVTVGESKDEERDEQNEKTVATADETVI